MATKAFDLSKFRKTLTKSIEGLGVGFNDPTDWISTGNYALNYLIRQLGSQRTTIWHLRYLD